MSVGAILPGRGRVIQAPGAAALLREAHGGDGRIGEDRRRDEPVIGLPQVVRMQQVVRDDSVRGWRRA